MLPTTFDHVLWAVTVSVEICVCVLAIRQGLARRYPTVVAYLLFMVLAESIRIGAYVSWGFHSAQYFGAHWGTHYVSMVVRGLAVAEICLRTLRPYEGVWRLTKQILGGAAGLLLIVTVWRTAKAQDWLSMLMLTAEGGLELIVFVTLLAFLGVARFYKVPVDRITQLVVLGLGLGIYASVQVINNSFFTELLGGYRLWWNYIRIHSFLLSFLVIGWALRVRVPAAPHAPGMLSVEMYNELAPVVSLRLRRLNDRLLELMK